MVPDPVPALLQRFQSIDLEEMESVALQDRIDTKFMFTEQELPEVLASMLDGYRILEVAGLRGSDYRTLYLDTPDLRSFRDHHNGRTFRNKVRYREYSNTGVCFLEVKRKTGRGRTDKKRLEADSIHEHLTAAELAFLDQWVEGATDLRPILWNEFTRMTFVHHHRPERLTIDRNMRFRLHGSERTLQDICVAELKQGHVDHGSPFARIMRDLRHRPGGISKYCIGLILLDAAPKHNSFKPTLLRLERLHHAA